MQLNRPTIALAFSLLVSIAAMAGGKIEWKLGADKDGIKVYTRKSEEGKIRTARAEMFLNATPDAVAAVLFDFNNYAKWFPNCRGASILKRFSDHEFVSMLLYKTPWPLPNMDCVERMTVEHNPNNDTTFIRVKAEPDFTELTSDVRVKQMQGTWLIIAQNGGSQVINTYYSDMGGFIPAFLANTQSVDIPYNIFSHMREYVINTMKLDKDRPVVKKSR